MVERLGTLLKRCRLRITLECKSLGPYLRLPARIGRVVTQEEIAEASGISRQWYAMMESDRPLRVSGRTLAQIANVLMMDADERAALFRLALPELRSVSMSGRSTELLEAFRSLRGLTDHLWSATTEAEALAVAREHTVSQLAPDLMVTFTRSGDGRWLYEMAADIADVHRGQQLEAELCGRCGKTVLDELLCYTSMRDPGELMSRVERDARFPHIPAMDRPALEVVGWADISFVVVNVRSQHGLNARLWVAHHEAYDFSEMERAYLSTLAELTSLALSGCVVSKPPLNGSTAASIKESASQ
jgi:transcriptional regulator with XRE-family HTH domain